MVRNNLLAILLLAGFNGFGQFITNNGVELKNSALVISNGSWTNDAGTNILNNGTIRITDSFVNNGMLDPASSGGFALKFDSDLNFKPGGSRLGFLTKDGAGKAMATGTISIKDSLLLKSGLIHLVNPMDTIFVGEKGILSSNPTSYIEGLMARAGTGDLLFPVGRNGNYLPIKFYKSNAKKITVELIDQTAGYTSGPGVDSLINFPFAWKVSKKIKADTAAYVELNYPNNMPIGANPIVVRAVSGKKYASMGARSAVNSGGRFTVKSYSRGLEGIFSVANGFGGDPVTDSLALVALYNGTGGSAWTTKTNWLTGNIDQWFGVTVTGQSITALNLSANKLTGGVPDQLIDILSLQTINLSGNAITSIPVFTLNPKVTVLNVSGNKLNFESLEPNASVNGLNYLNQADLGIPKDTLVAVGTPVEFKVNAGGSSSQYQWKRNGVLIPGANSSKYELAAISRSIMGSYTAVIINPLLPGLLLKSAVQKTLAYADLNGKLFADENVAASKGSLTLFRITPSAYDTIAINNVQANGSFKFEKVVLDDYQLMGFADTLTYNAILPTYYKNTILWEEADTISLENNLNDLTITSIHKPAPSSGKGSISGYLQEDETAGRVKDSQKAKRISGAGVSVRRVENTGRDKEERLVLVAYVFTDENGEFTLPNLPAGEYRLDIQYPGYPMDEASFITIPIGTGLKSQVSVEANVTKGKINVRKLVITGMEESESYSVDVYPNPAVDFIRLKFLSETKGRMMSLVDINGKKMIAASAENSEVILNVKDFKKGIYILHIKEMDVTLKTLKISIE